MFIPWKFSWPGYIRSHLLETEPKLVTLKASDLLREASGGIYVGKSEARWGRGNR